MRSLLQKSDSGSLDAQSSGFQKPEEGHRPQRPNSSTSEILASIQCSLAEEGRKVCQELSTSGYCVTSSLCNRGVSQAFEAAMDAALTSKQWKKKYELLQIKGGGG
jgi:hypothetical protein